MELVVLIGLQASGKTSFVRERLAGHVHVSKDHFPKATRRDRRQARLITEALAAGHSVVVDNTNPSVEVRAPLIALARQFGALAIAYHFESTLVDCLARNRRREGTACVPDVALYATAKRLQRPEEHEGFHRIIRVRLGEKGFVVSDSGG